MSSKRRWAGYLDIPAGDAGAWAITHKTYPAGHEFTTATLRTAFLGGQRMQKVKYDEPTRFHFLSEDESLWMSDWPVEQAQCDFNLRPITEGHVLVGGLGLGLCATILARRPKISHVTVVEKSLDVVKLVTEHLRVPRGKLTVIGADLFEYLDQPRDRNLAYDWAFYDTWTADSEGTFLETVVPLRHATMAKRWVRSDARVICWNEDVMRGQMITGLHTRLHIVMAPQDARERMLRGSKHATAEEMAEPTDDKWWDRYVPYWAWFRDVKPDMGRALRAAHAYSAVFGRYEWKERWESLSKHL